MPGFMVVIIIGAVVGFIARLMYPGRNTLHGFVLTVILGVAGASLATFLGRTFGWIEPKTLADPISMVIGSIIILFIWNHLALFGLVSDPGRTTETDRPRSEI